MTETGIIIDRIMDLLSPGIRKIEADVNKLREEIGTRLHLQNFVNRLQVDFLTELKKQQTWTQEEVLIKFLIVLANALAQTPR